MGMEMFAELLPLSNVSPRAPNHQVPFSLCRKREAVFSDLWQNQIRAEQSCLLDVEVTTISGH